MLDHPDIPLHTNGSENDSRCQVTKRQVSGGTRSDVGRNCRDAFLGLAQTCTKLGIAFWDYLGSRLAIPDHPTVPYLADLIRCRGPASLIAIARAFAPVTNILNPTAASVGAR